MAGRQVVRKGMIVLMLLSLLAFGSVAPVLGQDVNIDDGLVNVVLNDVTILENVDVDVAAQVVANLCAIDLVDAALLVSDVDLGEGPATCNQRGRSGRIVQVTNN